MTPVAGSDQTEGAVTGLNAIVGVASSSHLQYFDGGFSILRFGCVGNGSVVFLLVERARSNVQPQVTRVAITGILQRRVIGDIQVGQGVTRTQLTYRDAGSSTVVTENKVRVSISSGDGQRVSLLVGIPGSEVDPRVTAAALDSIVDCRVVLGAVVFNAVEQTDLRVLHGCSRG
ncbi:MAG: hypothetical protein GX071_09140 [Gammaproteobacteria bacterium]|nr:hypothetical protein [Gammaproteobacteria bacterium]